MNIKSPSNGREDRDLLVELKTNMAAILASFAPPAASQIKTFDTIARASIKTVNGVAIASVKTLDGIANT